MDALMAQALPAEISAEVRDLYGEMYALTYPALYIGPWNDKHQLNVANLTDIFDKLSAAEPRWLDLACGQAWHFSRFAERARMLGVDLSEAQLARARLQAPPHADFLCADMTEVHFEPASFDLITHFWGGYCYLRSQARIEALLQAALCWIAPGGALYIEVLLGEDLESFNRSRFSARTGFAVSPRNDDYSEWRYEDTGGIHLMTSPPLAMFLDIVTPHFQHVEARHDGAFMIHLIARGRC